MEQWINFLGGRPYEGWIQCFPIGWLGRLQEDLCVEIMQCIGGRSRQSAFIKFIWDIRIILGLSFFSWVDGRIVGEMEISLEGIVRVHDKPRFMDKYLDRIPFLYLAESMEIIW